MEKLAKIRDMEVRGALAALVDTGLVKCASREEFDKLASDVADRVGFEYSIDSIVDATSAVLEGGSEKTAAMTKSAADDYASQCYASLGELLLMKTAGQVDDQTFVAGADILMKEAALAEGINNATADMSVEQQNAVFMSLLGSEAAAG